MTTRGQIAGLLLAAFAVSLPTFADDGTSDDLTIPGTSTRVVDLLRDLAWDFDVDRAENGERKTLDPRGEGPAASRVVTFRMRSTEPHRRTDAGAEYLRLRLTAYEFESEAIALQALEAFKRWALDTPPGIICKGAVYRAQKGPFVYVLGTGCQFSRETSNRLSKELEAALSDVEAGPGYAIQCACGGGWDERAID